MEYLYLIVAIPAAVAASVMFVNILPFSLDKKLNPWIMFLAALLCLVLPHVFVFALAMTVPMGFIYGWTGVRLQGHEPVSIPFTEIRHRISDLRFIVKRRSLPVKEVLTREFPLPESDANLTSFIPGL